VPKKKAVRAIHARITELRLAHGWTQTEFAAKVGVDKTRVWHWENGDTAPSGRIMPIVADVLGVTIDELYREAA